MTDNELLLAISEMMDTKLKSELQPLKNDLQAVKEEVHQIKLYQENKKMEAAFADIEIMKKVIAEHSERLQKLA
ncbi:MAG: hypothetical protein NC517_04115 [Firmicutes bacterium]|nr:hypothetical protein [Bacillota bacterium]